MYPFGPRYFRDHALRELTDATGRSKVDVSDVRWVITVPAIWKQQSKQFMREAAYMVRHYSFLMGILLSRFHILKRYMELISVSKAIILRLDWVL